MNNQQSPDLFPDPPRRSRHRRNPMNRRQRLGVGMIFIAGLFFIAGGIYTYFDPKNILNRKTEIPLISPEAGPIKERPVTPGGVDVRYRDVTIFDQLGQKQTATAQIEHLLPPSESPSDKVIEVGGQKTPDQQVAIPPVTQNPPASVQVVQSPPVVAAPAPQAPHPVPTPPASTPSLPPAPPPASPKALEPIKPMEIVKPAIQELPKVPVKEQSPPLPSAPLKDIAIKLGKQGEKAAPKPETNSPYKIESKPVMPAGQQRVQLAAYPNATQAEEKMLQIISGHAALLRQVKLTVAKADLGSRGTFYRIQSQPLPVPAAHKLCADLKAAGVGCILVK